MNKLAQDLNTILKNTAAGKCLSSFGKEIFFPKGIVSQSEEASAEADRYNATIGMAFRDNEPVILKSLRTHLPGLTPAESVAYPPTAGIPALRRMWKTEMMKKNPSLNGKAFSLPTVVPGITGAISLTADLFCDPGDTVIVPDFHWGNYRLIFATRKSGTIKTFPLFQETAEGTVFNGKVFSETIDASPDKVIIILNFPNNPTGYSPRIEEKDEILQILLHHAENGKSIVLLCDDAYFGLFYEAGIIQESVFAEASDLHDNILAVKADGATKEEFAWGFRTGFLTFASRGLDKEQLRAMETKLKGAVRSTTSSSPGLSQHLLLKMMESRDYAEEKVQEYNLLEQKYRKVKSAVSSKTDLPLSPLPFNSGYFITMACREGIDAEVLRKRLLKRGIGVLSLGSRFIRAAYSSIPVSQIEPFFKEIFQEAGNPF
ncbi:MAG: aminotransferase class I/II-fold pyridoxal phosphate-dependent enzyme [Spirochaetia bacterium]